MTSPAKQATEKIEDYFKARNVLSVSDKKYITAIIEEAYRPVIDVLNFYAVRSDYWSKEIDGVLRRSAIFNDRGEKARQMLSKLEADNG